MTHEDFERIDIRQELRAARSQPEHEFASTLAERVRREHRRPRATPRAVLAFAATIVALAVVGAFGGISEAASTLSNAVSSIVHVSKPSKPHATKTQSRGGAPATIARSGSTSSGLGTSSSGQGVSSVGQGATAGGGGPQAPAAPGASPSATQYHQPCPPDEPRGPYIICRFPPLP
jgi:hypothetical protein